MERTPRLLLATTTWWPSLAVLASALEHAGFDVVVLCPKGHVAFQAHRFGCRELDRRAPVASLLAAIESVAPALIVPGDERVVDHLCRLYADQPHWRAAIEQAIGPQSCHAALLARVPLLEAAARSGFDVPDTRILAHEDDLEAWLARVPSPWVLKIDGAWGGEGVRVARDRATCRQAFRALRRGVPRGLALRRKLVNGDPFPWYDRALRPAPVVSAQAFRAGRPANCAAFALEGRLLGATVVEAVTTCGDHGPSTLVRRMDRPDVIRNVARLVAQLGLSGFLGFDFIMPSDGTAQLIEMNPRITMPCRIPDAGGTTPIAAAAAAHGATPRGARAEGERSVFASFPLAWLADPFAPELAACRDDVPWREPGMLRESLRPLWPERGLAAALPSRLRMMRDRVLHQARPDYRMRPEAWWMTAGGLGPIVDGPAAHIMAPADPGVASSADLGAALAETTHT